MKTTRRGFLGLIAAVAPVVAALGVAKPSEAAPLASCHQCEPDSPFPHVVSPAHPFESLPTGTFAAAPPIGDAVPLVNMTGVGNLTMSGNWARVNGNFTVSPSDSAVTYRLRVAGNTVIGDALGTSTTYVQDLIGRDEPIPPGRYAVASIKAY